jgi:hypothetical protein
MADVIFRNVPIRDMVLACRAARWLQERSDRNYALLEYGEAEPKTKFYVVRRKSCIVVRPA